MYSEKLLSPIKKDQEKSERNPEIQKIEEKYVKKQWLELPTYF